jgi:hypothetical protein
MVQYPSIAEQAFDKYRTDRTGMLRYAARGNREKETAHVLDAGLGWEEQGCYHMRTIRKHRSMMYRQKRCRPFDFGKNLHEETEEIRREKEKRKCDRKQTAS